MIDIKEIRRQPELYRQAAKRKRIELNLDLLLDLDNRCRVLQVEVDDLRRQRNELSEATQAVVPAERIAHLALARELTNELDKREAMLRAVQKQLRQLQLCVPSIPSDDTPEGESDRDNVEISRWGIPPTFDFPTRDHIELMRIHRMANFDDARKFAGSRAYALTGMGALLEVALMRFAIDRLLSKEFVLVCPPLLVKAAAMTGTGYFPIGMENAYALERDELYLTGTSEVSLVAMHANHTYEESELPLRYVGLSTCFRREAGAAGKDTRGLYRVHQFQKIEQVVITTNQPQDTRKMHEDLLQNAVEILEALELPYRIVVVCAGDLGLGQVRKHDIETWMPSRGAYGETHSCSTLNDFQSRRLAIKYVDGEGRKLFAHTLNNTAIASPRILIPLLENHQQNDGSICVPICLRPYLGGIERLTPS